MPSDPYSAALHFLYSLQGFGVKLGLDNMHAFLERLGHPQRRLAAVHIAGSNGKGSTAAMLASILTSAGYKTALYTSPHLVDYRERIRVDGKMIPKSFVASWIRHHRRWIIKQKVTFFETTTAIAFDWFERSRVDLAVIETGLGGRLDATNVLHPLLTIITSISKEHTHILGTQLRQITYEKAGILRRNVPCVTGVSQKSVQEFLRRLCSERGVPLIPAKSFSVHLRKDELTGLTVDLSGPGVSRRRVELGVGGGVQLQNLSTVLESVRILSSTYGFAIGGSAVGRGLSQVTRNTGFRGRMSIVLRRPTVYVDVAHNPDAVRRLVGWIGPIRRSFDIVFGVSEDKDFRGMLRMLKRVAASVTVVRPRTFRGRTTESIQRECIRLKIPARSFESVAEGVRIILAEQGRNRPVLVTGSHFVVGEALALLEKRKYLTISQ